MLNSVVLNRLRAQAALFLRDRCTIGRDITTRGAMGESVKGEEIIAENEPCRIVMAGSFNTSGVMMTGERDSMIDMYKLSVAYSRTLKVDYWIKANGIRFDVVRLETELSDDMFNQAIIARRR